MTMKFEDILEALSTLNEAQLRAVNEQAVRLVKVRRKVANAEAIAELQPGDRVRLVNTNPKYLNGLEAHVVAVKQSKVQIEFVPEHRMMARRYGPTCSAPATSLEKVTP